MRQNVLGIPVYGNGSSSCKRVRARGRSFLSEFLQDDSTTKHALSHRLLQTRFPRHTILAIPFLLKTLKCLLLRIPYRSIVATTTDIRYRRCHAFKISRVIDVRRLCNSFFIASTVVLLVVAIAERADFLFGLLPYSLLSLFRKHASVVQRLMMLSDNSLRKSKSSSMLFMTI